MRTTEEIEMLKVIWAFMLENGKVTNGDWSYYGDSYDGVDDWRVDEKQINKARSAVKSFGVNWEKTTIPDYECHSSFAGTDCKSDERECLLGTIVLNDESTYKIGIAEISEAAKHCRKSLINKNFTKPEDLVAKYFGG